MHGGRDAAASQRLTLPYIVARVAIEKRGKSDPTSGYSVVADGLSKQVLSSSMNPVIDFDATDEVRSPAPS